MSAPQSSNINGSHNIVVQAQGDGITVNLNQPHLSLVAWHRQRRKPERILDLLNPFVRAIPLVGRESAKADLESWLASDPVISVRCLIGSGGSGKTRLAIEFCESAEEHKWFAGFVTHKELTRFASQQNLGNWSWSKDTLVVVDYAAARARVLREWLVEMAQNLPSEGKRLRLLLLERHADSGIGWWHDVVTPGTFSEEPIKSLFDPITPVPLPSIAAIDLRRDILAYVMAEAFGLLGKANVLKPPAAGENAEFDRKLADPSVAFAPLFLTMAGVTAVEEGIPTLLTRGRAEMAQRLATDELARIEKLAHDRNLNADLLKYLAVGVTLAGGSSREELIDGIAEERAALGYPQEDDGLLVDAVSDALGVQLGRISPILPDLIGEAAILGQLTKLPRQKQASFVTRWFARVHGPVAATLVRTAQDYSAGDPLRWFDAVVDANQDLDSLCRVSDQIPAQTLRFRDRAVKIGEVVIEGLREKSAKGTNRSALAAALNDLANRLSALGRREEALARAQEAVDIRRELAAAQPDAFRPALARSLSVLADCLESLSRLDDAVRSDEAAVEALGPIFLSAPAPFSGLMSAIVSDYLRRLGTLSREPRADLADLLVRIVGVLKPETPPEPGPQQ